MNSTTPINGETLPDMLPLFPLPGALLLPHGRVPLNIFEPRYLNMFSDALGHGRIMGMIQPSANVEHPVPEDTPLYSIGCAGRIMSFSEKEDGHFAVTLMGICRFRVAAELAPRAGYRRVSADYMPFREDLEDDEGEVTDRKQFMELVERYFRFKGIEADWNSVRDAHDAALVTSLAMLCPFEIGEKQALLEASGTANRGDVLATLMEIAVGVSGSSDHTARH
jgi:Lon protease-like protein